MPVSDTVFEDVKSCSQPLSLLFVVNKCLGIVLSKLLKASENELVPMIVSCWPTEVPDMHGLGTNHVKSKTLATSTSPKEMKVIGIKEVSTNWLKDVEGTGVCRKGFCKSVENDQCGTSLEVCVDLFGPKTLLASHCNARIWNQEKSFHQTSSTAPPKHQWASNIGYQLTAVF